MLPTIGNGASPKPKKELSPVSRAKADKRNAQLRGKRAADVAASGGAKSGKKKRKMTDLTEEEIPVSGGGSSCTWKRSGELVFALLEEKQKAHFALGSREAGAGRRGGKFLQERLREITEDPGAAKQVYEVPGVG
jgi:hypothetical protein